MCIRDRVDSDGEWGEIRFDFENGTAEIIRLADWDTVKSKVDVYKRQLLPHLPPGSMGRMGHMT